MGRPINRQKFLGKLGIGGPNVAHQIQSTTWGQADSSALPGYLTKQNSTNRFRAHTVHGSSLTTLSNGTPTSAGYSSVQFFPAGTDPIVYAVATANLKAVSATVVAGGSNIHASDVLTLQGGSFGNAATITVNSVFGNGAVNAFTLNAVPNQGYTSLPSNIAGVATVDTSNANGTGAIFSINFGLESVTVVSGGSNYTQANLAFPGATTAPVTTATVVGGVVQNTVSVTSAGIINVNPTVVVEGTSGTVQFVKQIQSAEKVLCFNNQTYFWLPKGVQPPSDWANIGVRFGYLDTL